MVAAEQKVFDDIDTPIGGVPPEHVIDVWERAEPVLARVVTPETGYSLETLLTELQMARMQLWVIGDFQAIVVTTIVPRPLHKILWLQFFVGDKMDEWLGDWVKVQDEFARFNNCVAVEACGRVGWDKAAKPFGFERVFSVVRKEL